MEVSKSFSRRRLIKTGLVGGAGAIALAACGETIIQRVEVPVEVIKEVEVAGETIIKEVEVIKLHLESMKMVIAGNIKGTGGETGEEILTGLKQVCGILQD